MHPSGWDKCLATYHQLVHYPEQVGLGILIFFLKHEYFTKTRRVKQQLQWAIPFNRGTIYE